MHKTYLNCGTSLFAMAVLSAATEGVGATEGGGQPQTNGSGEQEQVQTITIQGLAFEAPQPYREGHVVTAGEASALNQTLAENLRNNFAPAVKKAMAEYRKANSLPDDAEVPVANLDHDALIGEFDKYAAGYEFGVRTAGGLRTPMDPISREAYRIATERVKAALQQKNIKLNSVSKEKMDEFVQGVLGKYPEIKQEAERRVSAQGAIALDAIGL